MTAVVRWYAPLSTGSGRITGYRTRAYRLGWPSACSRAYHHWLRRLHHPVDDAGLPKGRYSFRVLATNHAGASGWSSASGVVRAR